MSDPDILVAGCGTMARAVVEGWVRSGIAADRLFLFNPRPKEPCAGIRVRTELPAHSVRFCLLGFKPQQLGDAVPPLLPVLEGTTVMSLLAGTDLNTLSLAMPDTQPVRFMPNLAAAIGASPVLLAGRPDLPAAERGEVTNLADRLGGAEWIAEGQFDLATALAGSGPAFVYRMIDALAAGGAALGLDPAQALRLARAMTHGAASLAAISERSPAELADAVASPAGMTRAGLDVLDWDGALGSLLRETLAATRDRGVEMGQAQRRNQGGGTEARLGT